MRGSCKPHRLLQPPPRPVAYHGPAECLACREAKAGEMRVLVRTGRAGPRLQHERRRRIPRAVTNIEELSADFETSDRRHRIRRQADRRLRPLALRRANTFRPPFVAMRARKPWRRLRTSRDGW